jgi:flagellar motor protein MotB
VVEGQPAISLPADRVFTGATAALSKEGEATLRAAATVLGAFPERRLLVLVHTDDSFLPGDRFPSAWHLGASRAAAVGVALVAAGVPAPSLTVATRGAQSPASEAARQQARGASRRVEIVLQADPRDFPGWAPLNAQASGARAP